MDEKSVTRNSLKHPKYFELTTGHREWGNDTIDSIEYFDLCSYDCVHEKFEEWKKENENSHAAYFELSKT